MKEDLQLTLRPAHHCPLPVLVGMTRAPRPDWTCGECGRVWRDHWTNGSLPGHWVEIKGPSEDSTRG